MTALSENNWLIVGLGNPGKSYEKTPHNLGFMLIDKLAQDANAQVKREECRSLLGRIQIEDKIVEMAKPQTFMNLSGEAVDCLLNKKTRNREHLIVISDDLALPFGKIRLRPSGSAGGHNGLKSIAECLRTQDFIRLRIGIQPEHRISDTKSFVLDNFSRKQLDEVEKILATSAEAIRTVISDGVAKAMAQFN